ncbi:hypothetical protein ACJDU8_05660 [Clostridium sp. WILCCON 0269]|uniref:Uncharacterized protein n=1 Tax=Candidatus Clostridium eludens TaxID=3381663 RepID=A0ABW8SHK9_9CLOT
MKLITELIIRIILVISIIDGLVFYLINKNSLLLPVPFVISMIVITIIVLTINVLYCLHKRGIK